MIIFWDNITETFQNYSKGIRVIKVAGWLRDQTRLTAQLDFLFDSSLEKKMAKSTSTNSNNKTTYVRES